jgi:hypothetical protein
LVLNKEYILNVSEAAIDYCFTDRSPQLQTGSVVERVVDSTVDAAPARFFRGLPKAGEAPGGN